MFILDWLQHRAHQGEEGIEYDKGCERRKIAFMVSVYVVTDHIAGAQQQVPERALRVVVEEWDTVERSSVEVAASLFLCGFWLAPRIIPQLLPYRKSSYPRFKVESH